MPEMRKCKECGKLFIPKGREQYCSDIHYRPCPICGEPVEAKYLSDPPRKCDKCKGRRSNNSSKSGFNEIGLKTKSLFSFKPVSSVNQPLKKELDDEPTTATQPVVTSEKEPWVDRVDTTSRPIVETAVFCETETGSIRMYIGRAHKNSFIPGHEYLLTVKHDQPGHYTVIGTQDVTIGEDVNLMLPISSQISYHTYFGRVVNPA